MTRHPILAVDPGAISGVALVVPGMPLPRVVGTWTVRGARWELWLERAAAVLAAARAAALTPVLTVAIEVPAARGKSRRDYGPDTWYGLGQRAGAWRAQAWLPGGGVRVVDVPQDRWAAYWRVPAGKDGDGIHRIREASLVLGAREALAVMPGTTGADLARRVAVAEAILIGGAVAMGLLP